jgi:hypothetical protein
LFSNEKPAYLLPFIYLFTAANYEKDIFALQISKNEEMFSIASTSFCNGVKCTGSCSKIR